MLGHTMADQPKFGEVWEWVSPKNRCRVMVLGPEFEPMGPLHKQKWQVIHIIDGESGEAIHKLGTLTEYHLIWDDTMWKKINA